MKKCICSSRGTLLDWKSLNQNDDWDFTRQLVPQKKNISSIIRLCQTEMGNGTGLNRPINWSKISVTPTSSWADGWYFERRPLAAFCEIVQKQLNASISFMQIYISLEAAIVSPPLFARASWTHRELCLHWANAQFSWCILNDAHYSMGQPIGQVAHVFVMFAVCAYLRVLLSGDSKRTLAYIPFRDSSKILPDKYYVRTVCWADSFRFEIEIVMIPGWPFGRFICLLLYGRDFCSTVTLVWGVLPRMIGRLLGIVYGICNAVYWRGEFRYYYDNHEDN